MHAPVLLKETIEILNPQPGEFFIDGTIGSGGHAAKIFKRILPNGKLLGVDLDKNKQLVNLELLDAYKFLHTLNEKITKDMLIDLQEAELQVKNFRNYVIITLAFQHKNQKIEEKLPAFVHTDFKSPLIAAMV